MAPTLQNNNNNNRSRVRQAEDDFLSHPFLEMKMKAFGLLDKVGQRQLGFGVLRS